MKRNVLLIISNLEFGGAQRQIVEQVNNMNKDNFNVHVCSLSDYIPLADLIDQDVRVHVIQKNFKFDMLVIYKLMKLIKQHNIDVVHSFLFDAEIAARVAGKLSSRKVKVIGAERNTDYILKKVHYISYALTKNMVDLVVANSSAGARFNAEHTGVATEKYRVVYNGVDTDKFKPADQEAIRAELGIDTSSTIIGMFASFKEQKNHPFLLSAVKPLLEKYDNLKLLFVGDMLYGGMHGSDDYHLMVQNLMKEQIFENRCITLGNRDDIERIYPACDFTVLPSLFEGTPNVALESMACAVPVIATRVSDNDRIIKDGETGFIIELGNVKQFSAVLDKILEDEGLIKTLGSNARQHMKDSFSTKKLAENMERIYTEV